MPSEFSLAYQVTSQMLDIVDLEGWMVTDEGLYYEGDGESAGWFAPANVDRLRMGWGSITSSMATTARRRRRLHVAG